MAIKFLKADQLPAFLGYLAEKARVVAPIKTDGVVQFQPWAAGNDVELDVLLAKQSPKEFVFLQTETYLKFGYGTVTPEEGRGGRGGPAARGDRGRDPERGSGPGDLRPAALRRPRLRADGPGVRRLRRLLLRSALQRAARGDHAAGGHLPRPAVDLLLHGHRRLPGRTRRRGRALHPGGRRLHGGGSHREGRGGDGVRRP